MKILFIGNSRLGDAILSTGVLNLFNKKENNITVVCSALSKEIYSNFTSVQTIIIVKKKKNSRHWIEVYRKLERQTWDLIIDLRNTLISRILRKKKIYRYLRNNTTNHLIRELSEVVNSNQILSPKIFTKQADKENARFFINNIRERENILAVAPITNWKRKNWPLANYSQLISKLLKNKKFKISHVFILGSEEEFYLCEKLKQDISFKGIYNLAGKKNITTIYEILKYCEIFIGNDSGLTHLAAATGNKTLGLFGPSKENRYKPWGKNSFHIRTLETYDELVNNANYDRFETSSLMTGLSVKKVYEKCQKILFQ